MTIKTRAETANAVDALTRRGLFRASGAAALIAAARAAFPFGAFAAPADAPEVKGATFGFIALTDASPLIIAKEKGFFAKYGLPEVSVQKQASWGTTRDNLELGGASGGIDGAHILTPMPYLMSVGKITKNGLKVPMNILTRLNTDGQAISVANAYKDLGIGTKADGLREAFAKAKAGGKEIRCAMTFPGGTHDLWLRYWLAANGIDPDRDVTTIVVPPPQMVANMKVNTMEAFCVGEPWNAQLVHQKIGFTALLSGEIWPGHPEKSLAMRADWVARNPKAAKAVVMAVQDAAEWCDANIREMCDIVARRDWLKVPVEDIVGRSLGDIDYGTGKTLKASPLAMKFWKNHASYPFPSHDLWFLTEDIRWGYLPPETDRKALIAQVNREDLWRDAAKTRGTRAADLPPGPSRGVETFFDGKVFDPANPDAYLKALGITRTA
jgi:nitrate/nitrite transport system substrate-binding protein